MEPHEILSRGVPRGKARLLANILGISESLVLRWQRQPVSEENRGATGTPNPIERVDRIFDFMLIHSPESAQMLASRYQAKMDEFLAKAVREPLSEKEWKEGVAGCLHQSAVVMTAIVGGAPAEVVRQQWEAAKLMIEEIVRRKETGEAE
ncbi:MAG TPA: hypothetical protein VE262_21885 [Blastocatellia bacterium]|nr:hypothetical protein [Blastocatellia bacterium]